jgi:anaerobic magnesium-protoporphyrin IX monomethyl ester cyclase
MDDILLIYPYFYKPNRNAMLFHPLGIAQIAALLRRKGLSVRVIDCTFLTQDQAVERIKSCKPKITGIYVMLTMTESALWLAENVRRHHPGAFLVCGGPLPTLWPGHFTDAFDFVFQGEASGSFPGFCSDILSSRISKTDLEDGLFAASAYPGLCRKSKMTGEIVSTPQQSPEDFDLNAMPLADRRDYNHQKYQDFWRGREGFSIASLMTTFGCPFSCNFCSKPVYGQKFRKRKIGLILDEIRSIKDLGYDGFWIADDCFTLDMSHVRSFCKGLAGAKLHMKWICLSRTNSISPSDIRLMRESGCYKVYFGIESGDDGVLKLMNKKSTVSDSRRTVERFSRTDIKTAGFFMVGYPGETAATVEKTCAFALSLPLDEVSFSIPFPLPGTALHRQTQPRESMADWRHENENRMVFSSVLDEDFLKSKIAETYALFDLNRSNR